MSTRMKRKLTDEQENQVRRRFFKEGARAAAVCKEFKISSYLFYQLTAGGRRGKA